MAAIVNSNWAPRGPRNRKRPSRRMRLRCANSISTRFRSWRDRSNASIVNAAIPVKLPPGRLRLATRPPFTGSVTIGNTIGIVAVAAFATSAETFPPARDDDRDRLAHQFGSHPGKALVLIVRPEKFDLHVLSVSGAVTPPGQVLARHHRRRSAIPSFAHSQAKS